MKNFEDGKMFCTKTSKCTIQYVFLTVDYNAVARNMGNPVPRKF